MPADTDQLPGAPGDDCLPQARAASLPATGVLRADHVLLYGTVPGVPFLANGVRLSGWIVLTDRGEFRFYDKKLPAMTKAPALSAASVDQFVRKVSALGVWVRFGKKRYTMWFTGEPSPERRSAGIEEKTGQGADMVSGAGSVIAAAGAGLGQGVAAAGNVVSAGVGIIQLYRMVRNRKRRAAVKAAWYPVLRGVRPWHLINAAGEAPAQEPRT